MSHRLIHRASAVLATCAFAASLAVPFGAAAATPAAPAAQASVKDSAQTHKVRPCPPWKRCN